MFDKILTPPVGGWLCKCGETLDFPGMCDTCYQAHEKAAAKQHDEERTGTIPQKFRWATFDNPLLASRCGSKTTAAAKAAAKRLGGGDVNGAILLGAAGAGKTSLACAMLRSLIYTPVGFSGRFCSSIALALSRRETEYGEAPLELGVAKQSSILVLDDLGQEPIRDADVMTEVIHARHNADLPTIVTTWQDEAGIQSRYGDGTARRLLEGAVVIRVAR